MKINNIMQNNRVLYLIHFWIYINLLIKLVNTREDEIHEFVSEHYCGLLNVPIIFAPKCFKANTTYDEIFSNASIIKNDPENSEKMLRANFNNGTDRGQAPWAVYIRSKDKDYGYLWPTHHEHDKTCQGVIIEEWWVLTAAHCVMLQDRDFDVYVGDRRKGTSEKVEVTHKRFHPQFRHGNVAHCDYDVALLKLTDKITHKREGSTFAVNSICLPSLDDRHGDEEAVPIRDVRLFHLERLYNTRPLKYMELPEDDEYPNYLQSQYVDVREICHEEGCYCTLNSTIYRGKTCEEYSGAGLVKYSGINNRAVLIGILQEVQPGSGVACTGGIGNIQFVRVKKILQWIIDTIKTV